MNTRPDERAKLSGVDIYFLMRTGLNPKPQILKPKAQTLNPQPSLNPEP
jgi:hypothetical protein